MKKNYLKKNNIGIFIIILIMAFLFAIGCKKETLSENLEITTDNSALNYYNLSKRDLFELLAAIDKVKITSENGVFKLINVQEQNVSEKNLLYIKRIIESTNTNISKNSKNVKSSIPRLKSGGSETPPVGPVDCVARSTYVVSSDLGGSYTLTQIDNWINVNYPGSQNNGVPKEELGNVFSNFFNNTQYLPGPPIAYNIGNAGSTRIIAILGNMLSTTGHAVTLLSSNGVTAVYRDDQNNGEIRYCNAWDIVSRYQVSF